MGNIQVDTVKADVKDRLDNMVERQQVSQPVRNKLMLGKRFAYAIDDAYSRFLVKSKPELLSQLTKKEAASVDTSVNETSVGAGDGDGIVGNLKTYIWPTDAYGAREEGGVLNYVINDTELRASHSLPYISLKDAVDSPYYGSDADLFTIDLRNKRIYAPVNTSVALRYIQVPQTVADDSITELKIDTAYRSDITNMTLQSLMQAYRNEQESEPEQQKQAN